METTSRQTHHQEHFSVRRDLVPLQKTALTATKNNRKPKSTQPNTLPPEKEQRVTGRLLEVLQWERTPPKLVERTAPMSKLQTNRRTTHTCWPQKSPSLLGRYQSTS